MNLLLLDFESVDKGIQKGIGAGWVYPNMLKPIGWSTAWLDTETKRIKSPNYMSNGESALSYLKSNIDEADGMIAHNAQYELGILDMLGISIDKIKIYDTKIIAKLYDNNLKSYSLDTLSRKYLAKEFHKNSDILGEVVRKHQLLKTPTGKPVRIDTKSYLDRAVKWSYNHMDLIQELEPLEMARYCNQDLLATGHLFLHMVEI